MTIGEHPVVASCFDRNYLPHVATALHSAALAGVTVDRWLLFGDESVDDRELERLRAFGRDRGLAVEVRRFPTSLLEPFDDGSAYPRVAWYRTMFPELFSDVERMLYLDGDLLVLHDLSPLWRTALGAGDLFGAVIQPSYAVDGRVDLGVLGLPEGSPYLNSGVLVMDLERMRQAGFVDRLRALVARPDRPPLRFADQDAFNILCAGEFTSLDPKWNAMSSVTMPFLYGASWADDRHHDAVLLERAGRTPAVAHFEGPLKPWTFRSINPFRDLYRAYRATTPWPLEVPAGSAAERVLNRMPATTQAWLARRLRRF